MRDRARSARREGATEGRVDERDAEVTAPFTAAFAPAVRVGCAGARHGRESRVAFRRSVSARRRPVRGPCVIEIHAEKTPARRRKGRHQRGRHAILHVRHSSPGHDRSGTPRQPASHTFRHAAWAVFIERPARAVDEKRRAIVPPQRSAMRTPVYLQPTAQDTPRQSSLHGFVMNIGWRCSSKEPSRRGCLTALIGPPTGHRTVRANPARVKLPRADLTKRAAQFTPQAPRSHTAAPCALEHGCPSMIVQTHFGYRRRTPSSRVLAALIERDRRAGSPGRGRSFPSS